MALGGLDPADDFKSVARQARADGELPIPNALTSSRYRVPDSQRPARREATGYLGRPQARLEGSSNEARFARRNLGALSPRLCNGLRPCNFGSRLGGAAALNLCSNPTLQQIKFASRQSL